jgi:steroid delta-isomerase-like uncharacterized protein
VSSDERKATVRRFFAAIEARDADALADDLLAPDYRLRFDSLPEMGRDEAIGFFVAFVAAFPDIRHHIEDQVAEGDRVATRLTVRGTHQGDFMGMPPTGRTVEIGAINIKRFADGKIAEHWVRSDALGLLQQLGAIPAPGA